MPTLREHLAAHAERIAALHAQLVGGRPISDEELRMLSDEVEKIKDLAATLKIASAAPTPPVKTPSPNTVKAPAAQAKTIRGKTKTRK